MAGPPTPSVQHGGDDRAGWLLHTRVPDPRLRGLVVGPYQGYAEWGAPIHRRALPAASLPVILALDAAWLIRDPGRLDDPPQRRGSFVAGLRDRASTNASADGRAVGMQLDLSPLGARLLLGLPLHELESRVVDLGDVLGDGPTRRLLEALASERAWSGRFDLLDRALLRRAAASRTAPSPDVARAWAAIRSSGGRTTVGGLARELGCSRKHLGVRFREQVGLSPGRVARVVRFERAVDLLHRPAGTVAAVAQECGYYDQSHLDREVRAMAGTTPSALRAAALAYGGVADGGVTADGG